MKMGNQPAELHHPELRSGFFPLRPRQDECHRPPGQGVDAAPVPWLTVMYFVENRLRE